MPAIAGQATWINLPRGIEIPGIRARHDLKVHGDLLPEHMDHHNEHLHTSG